MRAPRRGSTSRIVGPLAVLAALTACDGLGGRSLLDSQPASNITPWSGPLDAGRPSLAGTADAARDAGVPTTDAGDAYLVMCRHYCDALAETDLYFCAASPCFRPPPPGSDLCFQDRCAPRLVQPSECLVQCDALDRQYRAYCGEADASSGDAGVCPSPADAHDAACRAGCALAPDGAVSDS